LTNTRRSRRKEHNTELQGSGPVITENRSILFSYFALLIVGAILVFGYFVYYFNPPRKTIITIDNEIYNSKKIVSELGFFASYMNNGNNSVESMLLDLPNVFKNRYILNKFGPQIVDPPSEAEIKLKISQILKVPAEIYQKDKLSVDVILANIRSSSNLSRISIADYARSILIQDKIKGLYSLDLKDRGNLSFVKRISIESEAISSLFLTDYQSGKTIEELLTVYKNSDSINVVDVGWRLTGYIGSDLPAELNDIKALQLSGPFDLGTISYFYYIEKQEQNGLITPPLAGHYEDVRLLLFVNEQSANIYYREIDLDQTLRDYIVKESEAIKLRLMGEASVNPNQNFDGGLDAS
jgi:hypothetical protein